MKKNLGSVLALYPMPLTVIGAMDGEEVNKSDVLGTKAMDEAYRVGKQLGR